MEWKLGVAFISDVDGEHIYVEVGDKVSCMIGDRILTGWITQISMLDEQFWITDRSNYHLIDFNQLIHIENWGK